MAEGFLGNLMSGIFPQNQRDLDEEERRMIEEMRAAGACVPQERPVNYLQYGGGRRRDENLAAMRDAIEPEKKRRTDDIMDARGAALRQRQALEKFNQEQEFNRRTAQRNRAKAVEDEARRRMLQQQQKKADAGFQEWSQRSVLSPDFVKKSGREYYDQNINTMTPRQRAELQVLNRAATPALTAQTQLESAQTQLGSSQLDLASKQRADELASAVHNTLRGTDYANILAGNMFVDARLKNVLNESRLAVAQGPLAQQILAAESDKTLATLQVEKLVLDQTITRLRNNPTAVADLEKAKLELLKAEKEYKEAQTTYTRGRGTTGSGSDIQDLLNRLRPEGRVVNTNDSFSTDEANNPPGGTW